ncbi:MAG: DNA polymerase III subunit delta' [Acidobacteriota bacterium]
MNWQKLPCDPRVAQELALSVRSHRLAPSLLFCGPPGSGKRAAAVAVAQALLCPQPGPECGECSACRRVSSGQHPDFHIWEAEGRELRVEQARALRAATRLRPFEAAMQVHLLAEAERLNVESSNALLKTLEEPSPHAVLILLACAPSLLLPTIRSRCQVIRFRPLSTASLRERLEREDALTPAEAAWRARLGQGSLVRARAFSPDEPERAAGFLQTMESLMGRHQPSSLTGRIVEVADEWAAEAPPSRALERLLEICRDALLAREGAPDAALLRADLRSRLEALGKALERRLPSAVERLEAALADLRRPMRAKQLLEEALVLLLVPL